MVAAHHTVGKSQCAAVENAAATTAEEGFVAAHGAVGKSQYAAVENATAFEEGEVAAHRAVSKSQCAAVEDAAAVGVGVDPCSSSITNSDFTDAHCDSGDNDQ